MTELILNFNLDASSLGHLTSAVQFGFITGTLCFAILTIADRYSPSKVFFISALLGSVFNLGVVWEDNVLSSILVFRFLTGFFLAGIYPVGMKIAADYYEKGLGKSLGFLVGALVLGTAFPHLLVGFTKGYNWEAVIIVISCLSVLGGLLVWLLIPDGPYRKASKRFDGSAFFMVFQNKTFRSSAFGYFGHMWELYTFWAFVPIILHSYSVIHPDQPLNIPLLSFLTIGIGGLSCVIGGYISRSLGVKQTASYALFLSGMCCLVSPLIFFIDNSSLFVLFLVFWGMMVIADSPLFSTLVAQNAPAEIKGTALTIVNSIGFFITIISIQLVTILHTSTYTNYIYMILAIGPALGLMALIKNN